MLVLINILSSTFFRAKKNEKGNKLSNNTVTVGYDNKTHDNGVLAVLVGGDINNCCKDPKKADHSDALGTGNAKKQGNDSGIVGDVNQESKNSVVGGKVEGDVNNAPK